MASPRSAHPSQRSKDRSVQGKGSSACHPICATEPIYEPQADGSLELVAVENLVFEAAWNASGKTEELVLSGRSWDHMADDPATPGDEAHGFMPHYDQHVWLFRENPMGVLMPFNPMVTCDHHKG
jgi:hypothetical protein